MIPLEEVDWDTHFENSRRLIQTASRAASRQTCLPSGCASRGKVTGISRSATLPSMSFVEETLPKELVIQPNTQLTQTAQDTKSTAKALAGIDKLKKIESILGNDTANVTQHIQMQISSLSVSVKDQQASLWEYRMRRFFDLGDAYMSLLPRNLSATLSDRFSLIPTVFTNTVDIPPVVYPEDAERRSLILLLKRYALHYKPSESFPPDLIPLCVLVRFFISAGLPSVTISSCRKSGPVFSVDIFPFCEVLTFANAVSVVIRKFPGDLKSILTRVDCLLSDRESKVRMFIEKSVAIETLSTRYPVTAPPPEGMTNSTFRAGLAQWDVMHVADFKLRKLEFATQFWRLTEFISCPLQSDDCLALCREYISPIAESLISPATKLDLSDYLKILTRLGVIPLMINAHQAKELFYSAESIVKVEVTDEEFSAHIRKMANHVSFMQVWKSVVDGVKLAPLRAGAERVACRFSAYLADISSRGSSLAETMSLYFQQGESRCDRKTFASRLYLNRTNLCLGTPTEDECVEAAKYFDVFRDGMITVSILEKFASSFILFSNQLDDRIRQKADFSFGPAALAEILMKIGVRYRLLFPGTHDHSICPTSLHLVWLIGYLKCHI